ncbi:hypothetical protein BCR44DRAFT_1441091 [Catenaria anguillulae PL171]|uniref:Oxidoreductase-like domain-containing protein n=1 Tax=Catenaria anguillulae PL171 TaxID=765915 RepID=A0A1Y2HC04_9FUNG|nr:hypothetical protein BCR44DRAFT_1441091 [Catenaria anguillulae PL171]
MNLRTRCASDFRWCPRRSLDNCWQMNLLRASRPCHRALQLRLVTSSAIVADSYSNVDRLAGFYTVILDSQVPRSAPHIVHAPNKHSGASASPVSADPGRRSIAVPTASLASTAVKSPTKLLAAEPSKSKEDTRNSHLAFAEPVPTQPDPPDNCCMSGCIHCVWNLYVDDYHQLNEWMAVDEKLMVDPPSADAEKREALAAMDPTVRMFWEMENKLNRDT